MQYKKAALRGTQRSLKVIKIRKITKCKKNNSQPQSSFFTIDLKMHQINRLRLYRAPKTDKQTQHDEKT
jgi:hypothetical protein